MRIKHLIKLAIMAGIVISRQNSPVDFFFGLVDGFDRLPGGTNIQMPGFDESFAFLGPFDGPNLIVGLPQMFPDPFRAG